MGARTTVYETTTCKIHTIDITKETHTSEFCDRLDVSMRGREECRHVRVG